MDEHSQRPGAGTVSGWNVTGSRIGAIGAGQVDGGEVERWRGCAPGMADGGEVE